MKEPQQSIKMNVKLITTVEVTQLYLRPILGKLEYMILVNYEINIHMKGCCTK